MTCNPELLPELMVYAKTLSMTDQRWEQVVQLIQQHMTVEEHERGELENEPGTVEWYVFSGPAGRMRLERYVRPRVTGSHMITSRRAGAGGREEKEYSKSETVSFIKLWKMENNEWTEIDPSVLSV